MPDSTSPAALFARLVADPDAGAWAVLRREGRDDVDLLLGDVVDVDLLDQVTAARPGSPVLALIPYRQVRERGYEAHDDGTPLRVLVAHEHVRVPLEDVLRLLPTDTVEVEDLGTSVSDADYVEAARRVIEEEIGRGEGANFVLRRDVLARTSTPTPTALLVWLRALLETESGAYWTFAVRTPGHNLVGATPERHVSAVDGHVRMNPISGTFRHGDATGAELERDFQAFIRDVKETEELFMVVDEEMKMMARVCAEGGRITGPALKQMSRLTHTEYLLDGVSHLDPREVLRETMFAPTVTGSPMQNACAVIHRREPTGRGYYSGVLALFERESADAPESLDAPILIRTAEVDDEGTLRVRAGATLVRHSDPTSEAAETSAKAAGVLGALGMRPRPARGAGTVLADLPGVGPTLAARNDRLSPFWLVPQAPEVDPLLQGKRVLLVDAEDTWTHMIAHMLRHLGMTAQVAHWSQVSEADVLDTAAHDLVLFGPGPGDPADRIPRMARLRGLLDARLGSGAPLVAVCLSHQVLGLLLGLPVGALPAPNQGVQIDVDLFGERALVGFYNTFVLRCADAEHRSDRVAGGVVRVAAGPATGHGVADGGAPGETDAVVALRAPRVASLQGHAESVLSRDGLRVLRDLARHALG